MQSADHRRIAIEVFRQQLGAKKTKESSGHPPGPMFYYSCTAIFSVDANVLH
jgi:hypothetical protein